MTVVCPLLLGQFLRRFIKDWMEQTKPPFGAISSCVLLLIIYTTFCDTFSHKSSEIDSSGVVAVVVLIICLQCCLLLLTFSLATMKDSSFTACRYGGDHVLFNAQVSYIRNSHVEDRLFRLQVSLVDFHPAPYLSSSADFTWRSVGACSEGMDGQRSTERKINSECNCLDLQC
ncbi:hypothetical protein OS493_037347 [Desmophyllum pertusum]|uniref:Uncharacterized protein n=1 Tax=Desmophyllum pertusum TaxID=174260 RepID=A0A9W9YHR1_9CNID|nr:hypothetical protein OS493_037347 [Desmophyllum pertusum]